MVQLNQNIQNKYEDWLNNPYFDQTTKNNILHMRDEEIIDSFGDLQFGTGGIRAKIGDGTSRINKYVIRKITQGISDTIKNAPHARAVISFDSRNFSREFALETALTFACNGVEAYLFPEPTPTPVLSYAVRYLKADIGIMITASHNPKEYNGYKVYGNDGGQVTPLVADQIAANINNNPSWVIQILDEAYAQEHQLLKMVDDTILTSYYRQVKGELINWQLLCDKGSDLQVVYTPLHGSGKVPVKTMLKQCGITNLFVVPEQQEYDGDFPTVAVPNPEDPTAFILATAYGKKVGADILLATDPDCDRLGVQCLDGGVYHSLTGNQVGVILEYYLLSSLQEQNKLNPHYKIIKSMVSTSLATMIAADFGIELIDVPVGFKYIGEKIKEFESEADKDFLFGFEESLGYLKGTYTRDKDAVLAGVLICEAALYYKAQHKTLKQVLTEIYDKYGYYLDEQVALSFTDFNGQAKITQIMTKLRADVTLEQNKIDFLPQGLDMLKFTLENDGYIMLRPSGTEPKIRIYFCVYGKSLAAAQTQMQQTKDSFLKLI